jgi:site-specific DNA recombinase
MSVALYARVSSQLQAQTGTIEQQLGRLIEHARQAGLTVSAEQVFRDDGYSGAHLARPGLDGLRDAVRTGLVGRVLVTAPDRLARNYVHQMLLIEEFEQHGCVVEFLERPMSEDPNDRLLLEIRGAVAEYERTLIGERMRRGRQAKYRAGLLLPWTRAPYGYRVDPDRPRDPRGVRLDEAQAAAVREVFHAYAEEGSSLKSLVRHLNDLGVPTPSGKGAWCKATLCHILANPAYKGEVYAGQTHAVRARNRHSALRPVRRVGRSLSRSAESDWIHVASIPPIVARELFDLVQGKLEANRRMARRHNSVHQYLLRALVSCGSCGLACPARTVFGKYAYYRCNGATEPLGGGGRDDRDDRKERRCQARPIPTGELDALVWQDLAALLRQPELIRSALERANAGEWLPQELRARRELIQRGQRSLARQLERLTEAYLSAVIPLAEYRRRRADIERQTAALEQQERQLEAQARLQTDLAGSAQSVTAFCQRVAEGLDQATFERKRQLVELLVDRVVVTEGLVEIRYVIPTSPASEHVRFCHLRLTYCRGSA